MAHLSVQIFYDLGYNVGGIAVATFTGGKLPDIAVSLPALYPRLLDNLGDGTFQLGPDPNGGSYGGVPTVTLTPADFRGDGIEDLVSVGGFGSATAVFFGNGDGTFAAPSIVTKGSNFIADVNHDGRADMLSQGVPGIIALLGQADGSFVEVDSELRATTSSLLAAGDINKDGNLDLLIATLNSLDIYFGKGNGAFVYASSISTPYGPPAGICYLADLDEDGNIDIIFAPEEGGADPQVATIFYGKSDGTFASPIPLPLSHNYWNLSVSDINQDGKPDLVFSDGYGIAIVLNTGKRTFAPELHYVAGSSVSFVNVADVNGDGFPDIVASNATGTAVTVLLNQPTAANPTGLEASGTVSVSPEPSPFGAPFAVTLVLSGQTGSSPTPTGTVDLQVDGVFIASVPLSAGSMKYELTTVLEPGPHAIVASYNGDSIYAGANFAYDHVVSPGDYSTTTSLIVTPTTLLASQTLHMVATALTNAGTVPLGYVTFYDGTNVLHAVALDTTGTALLDISLLNAGVHSISATYDGATISYPVPEVYLPSTSKPTSVTITDVVTTTTLSASATSLTAGTVVTFDASVTSGTATPFGGVTFYDGSEPIGTMALDATGKTSFSTAALAAGTHMIGASFNANGVFGGSSASTISVTVTPSSAPPSFTVLSFKSNGNDETASLLNASVTTMSGTPRGQVTFLDRGVILGRSDLDQTGLASLRVSLAIGAHVLYASFAGGSSYSPSVSPGLTESWSASGAGYTVSVDRQIAESSHAIPLNVEFLPGFAGELRFSCAAGLPPGYTCQFNPASLTSTGVSSLAIVPVTETASIATHSRFKYGALIVFGGILSLGCGSKRRRRLLQLLTLCVLLTLGGWSCGSSPQPVEQNSVVAVQASSTSHGSEITHSVQILVSFADAQE